MSSQLSFVPSHLHDLAVALAPLSESDAGVVLREAVGVPDEPALRDALRGHVAAEHAGRPCPGVSVPARLTRAEDRGAWIAAVRCAAEELDTNDVSLQGPVPQMPFPAVN